VLPYRIASTCPPSIKNGILAACNVASVKMHSTVKHRCFVEKEIFIVKMITFGELHFFFSNHYFMLHAYESRVEILSNFYSASAAIKLWFNNV
jgi:hypothetical protein